MKTDLHIHAIPAFSDNYIWLMHDGRDAVVVDPGATEPVEEALSRMGLGLSAIVLTHLHYDHCWGVPALLKRWSVPVYGPILNDYDRATHPPFPKPGTVPLDCVTQPVVDGDRVAFSAPHVDLTVMAVPGHTRGHLAFWDRQRGRVFTGDSLLHARNRAERRERGEPTWPSTIALEKATNPFLRLLQPDIVQALRSRTGHEFSTPSETSKPCATGKMFSRFKEYAMEPVDAINVEESGGWLRCSPDRGLPLAAT